MADSPIQPFQISIHDDELDLLKQKLRTTRMPPLHTDGQWAENNGVTLSLMKETIDFWRGQYDWRSEEALLNKIPQYTTTLEIETFGPIDLHFVHSQSSNPNAIPLLFLHGWPGFFAEVRKILPGLNEAGFHVVAPSLPGFGFSSCPMKSDFKIPHIATLMQRLMSRLEYHHFVVQGGDWGAMIALTMAAHLPDHVKAVHVNMLSTAKPDFPTGEPAYTEFEKHTLSRHTWFETHEFAYYNVQNSKPRTLGFALHDSPVGMLAWMADKLFSWSDSANYAWSPVELITWTLLHYFPGPTTAFQIYRENDAMEMFGDGMRYVDVPVGVSAFREETEMVPRCWAEKRARVVWWREHAVGGHFAAYERPGEVVKDLTEFFGEVWEGSEEGA